MIARDEQHILEPRQTHKNRERVSQIDVFDTRHPLLFTYVGKKDWHVFKVRNVAPGTDILGAFNAAVRSVVKKHPRVTGKKRKKKTHAKKDEIRIRIRVGTTKNQELSTERKMVHPLNAKGVRRAFGIKSKKSLTAMRLELDGCLVKMKGDRCSLSLHKSPVTDAVAASFMEHIGVPPRNLAQAVRQAIDLVTPPAP